MLLLSYYMSKNLLECINKEKLRDNTANLKGKETHGVCVDCTKLYIFNLLMSRTEDGL